RLWESFLAEASRFDEQARVALFGRPDPVSRPPADPFDWTDQHKRLIGEFVGRHHATLANEIALIGVPGPDGPHRLQLAEIPDWMRELIGLIAQSHTLDLRVCTDRLPANGRKVW